MLIAILNENGQSVQDVRDVSVHFLSSRVAVAWAAIVCNNTASHGDGGGVQMAFSTPRGLKIRIDVPQAFGLMGRLGRKEAQADAFRVLKTCEAIQSIPDATGFIFAMAAVLYTKVPVWGIAGSMIMGEVVGVVLTRFGLFNVIRPTGLLAIAHFHNKFSGFGVLIVLGLTLSYLTRGWIGSIWWIAGIICGVPVTIFLQIALTQGIPITVVEIDFINAYRLHADRLGMTRDVDVHEAELETRVWEDCLNDYAEKHPSAFARI